VADKDFLAQIFEAVQREYPSVRNILKYEVTKPELIHAMCCLKRSRIFDENKDLDEETIVGYLRSLVIWKSANNTGECMMQS